MIRPVLLAAISVFLVAVSPARRDASPSPAQRKAMEARQAAMSHKDTLEAEQINALATNLHSLKDSKRLIGLVEKQFPDHLKPREIPRKIRRRIVLAEYESATNPAKLIPDQRIADAWNWFMGQIGAPKQDMVNAATVYALRDAEYTGARMMWRRNFRSIWTVPGIYALGADGKVDRRGATALEAIDMIYLMASIPHNLKFAQQLAGSGKLFSDEVAQAAKHRPKHPKPGFFEHGTYHNKVDVAARRYVRTHGVSQYKKLLEELAERVFPAQSAG